MCIRDSNKELKQVAEEQKKLNEEEKKGSSKDIVKRRTELVSKERELKLAKQELSRILVNEEKIIQSSKGDVYKRQAPRRGSCS